MRLRKRGDTWHATIWIDGKRVTRTTHCTDKRAAELAAREWERTAASGAPSLSPTQAPATVNDALRLLLERRTEEAHAGTRSKHTVAFYDRKARHVRRVLGPVELRALRGFHVDDYITKRRSEAVTDSTISKEIITLRASLKLAARREWLTVDPSAIMPANFSPNYKPRTRALTFDEVDAVLDALSPPRAAQVAFMLATGARWSECCAAQPSDLCNVDGGTPLATKGEAPMVLLRGTKTEGSLRMVPVVHPRAQQLLRRCYGLGAAFSGLPHAEGAATGALLFTPWPNVRHDLEHACAIAGCRRAGCAKPRRGCTLEQCVKARPPRFSPNDLRRTFATWLRAGGVEPQLIAPAMGHRDSRMVERVYGRLAPQDLAKQLSAALSSASNGIQIG